jgi:tRNA(Ile)-lysidine synthase
MAHVLRWKGTKPTGNIEAVAREARYSLMGNWCRSHEVRALFLGHTRDDQAETFLLRLSRGTGLDGLAAMPATGRWPVSGFDDLRIVRPLLSFDRVALQDLLRAKRIAWRDDPMNMEQRFARTKIRAIWPALEQAGLSKPRIADAAIHLARARAALESETDKLLALASVATKDGVALDAVALATASREIGLRALAAILMRVGGAAYRPRFERLENLFDSIILGELRKARTLHGCRIGPASKALATFGPSTLVIVRERGRMKPEGSQVRT